MSEHVKDNLQLILNGITLLVVLIGGTLSYARQGEFIRDNQQEMTHHLEIHKTLEHDVKEIKDFIRELK